MNIEFKNFLIIIILISQLSSLIKFLANDDFEYILSKILLILKNLIVLFINIKSKYSIRYYNWITLLDITITCNYQFYNNISNYFNQLGALFIFGFTSLAYSESC